LWLGEVEGDVAHVSRAIVPEQKSISRESGVGYFVEGNTLFQLNRALAQTGLRLIAQVHSHPNEAYHSEADDQYAIVTAEGGLSFVVPNFGKAPLDPTIWAIYRLTQGEWRGLNMNEAKLLISMSE
jgi:proteasome lid subunit RPN8/RPN11